VIGSAWEDPEVLARITDLYRRETAGSMVGHPVRLPDGSTYEIDWGDDELEGAA
jgi:hypothetical protein